MFGFIYNVFELLFYCFLVLLMILLFFVGMNWILFIFSMFFKVFFKWLDCLMVIFLFMLLYLIINIFILFFVFKMVECIVNLL